MSVSRGLKAYDTQILGIAVNPQDSNAHPADPNRRFDNILECIKQNGFDSLGEFLVKLFAVVSDRRNKGQKSQVLVQTVASFLNGKSNYDAVSLVDTIYNSRFSAPLPTRASATPESAKHCPDESTMARYKLQQWALGVVETMVDSEAKKLVSRESELRLSSDVTWDFALSFSFEHISNVAHASSPSITRLLEAIAVPLHKRKSYSEHNRPQADANIPSAEQEASSAPDQAAPIPDGQGGNRRDPSLIINVALMMMLNARNIQFTAFQKLIGVWLFANSAARDLFDILGRMGLCVSYSGVLSLLKTLAGSAQKNICARASERMFELVYDNINRQKRVWDSELGDRNVMNSGTAAVFVVLEDCDRAAFDSAELERARAKQSRRELSIEVLERRIDEQHLRNVMAVHIASFLIQSIPRLSPLQPMLNNRLRNDLAKHRMQDGRRTEAYPMATSEHDEGSTRGNREVIDDLMLRQLKLNKDEIDKIITIFAGDQSTVEKIRTLKKYADSCPHGYDRYGWSLAVVALWHMGWADLERILATHWGGKPGTDDDISTFAFVNQLLNRGVKNVARPDYYPAQNLVFDNLRTEVIDCWREHFRTEDLGQHLAHLHPDADALEMLLKEATDLADTYMFTPSAESARTGQYTERFPIGRRWTPTNPPANQATSASESTQTPFEGDEVLANTILRMRDSMLHYEFHSAIADGDIGRAMNIMSVWTFTFCGSGKSKYTNELLELACNFEYEFSDELQQAVLNNWLCNLTGLPGHWFPMDLLMEHNINLLKKMSGRHTASFSTQFFQEIISLNIRHFLEVKETIRTAVRIKTRSGTHHKKKKATAMEHLARTMRENELHRFCSGRTYGFTAEDNFVDGWTRFALTTRLSDFIDRTLADIGDLQDVTMEDLESSSGLSPLEESEEDQPGTLPPLPHVWSNGTLVQGDVGLDSESEDEH